MEYKIAEFVTTALLAAIQLQRVFSEIIMEKS